MKDSRRNGKPVGNKWRKMLQQFYARRFSAFDLIRICNKISMEHKEKGQHHAVAEEKECISSKTLWIYFRFIVPLLSMCGLLAERR